MEILDSRLKLFMYCMALSFLLLILRMIRFAAPRGGIFDRNSVPLAVNDTNFCMYHLGLNTPQVINTLQEY